MQVSQSATLRRVIRGDLCAGCGACAGLFPDKISMTSSATGWPRPRQSAPLMDNDEDMFAAICPGAGQRAEAVGDGRDHPLWGRHSGMRRALATDAVLRHRAASGGALSAVLAYLLASGRVDAVIQTAAALPPDPAFANRTVTSLTAADVLVAAGSRYAPSAPLSGLSEWLASGKRLAFVGKPCDAAALRALTRRDPKAAERFPVILSFFCAGVPSGAGGNALLQAMAADPTRVTAFRYRGEGWPGDAVAKLDDGSERRMSYHESWGGVLSRHLQHRCKLCADGTGTAADLSFGDPWEVDARGFPLFADAPGQSLAVIRTPLGAEFLAEAEAAGHLVTTDFDISTLATIQPGQRRRRRALLARIWALRLAGRPVPHYRGMGLLTAARQAGPLFHLREFAGMFRRVLRQRP